MEAFLYSLYVLLIIFLKNIFLFSYGHYVYIKRPNFLIYPAKQVFSAVNP